MQTSHSAKGRARVLIVDDDRDTSEQLGSALTRDGYVCDRVPGGTEALQAITTTRFDVVVSDIKMAGMNGLDLLDRVVKLHPRLPVILCTGYAAIAGAVDATKRGAFEYLVKPYELHALQASIASAIRSGSTGPPRLPARPRPETPTMLGEGGAMALLERSIASVAASSAPVFVLGESGTGKDLVARAIHASSPRRDQPFVAVNVSAIPEQLLESEIFGHVRGAFSGASDARRGLLSLADGGTLFLDEIGDMPIGLQSKLLRVLQFGEVRPVGSDRVHRVDVRIVTATHRDVPKLIEAGRFREDLYFRIHVLPILVPPLRERRSDIPMLAKHFLEAALARTPTSPVRALSPEAERLLVGAPWPGNVRELESTIERLVVFGRDATIGEADLPFLHARSTSMADPTMLASLREVSERHVSLVLAATGGDKRRAADILGVDLSTLYRWQQRAAPTKALSRSAGVG